MTTIKGTKEADYLVGGNDADTLKGGRGADVINGAGGDDNLIGGKGRDFFIIDNTDSLDTIRDFESGKDRIMFIFDEPIGVAHIDDDLYVVTAGNPMMPVVHLEDSVTVALDDLLII